MSLLSDVPTLLKLFCSKCNKLVDSSPPRQTLPGTVITATCGHNIKVRLIPFFEARWGAELCFNNSDGHYRAAARLFKAKDYARALFMVLTGYEEMAKCDRILNAAHYSRE
jgi:hypothetical protein